HFGLASAIRAVALDAVLFIERLGLLRPRCEQAAGGDRHRAYYHFFHQLPPRVRHLLNPPGAGLVLRQESEFILQPHAAPESPWPRAQHFRLWANPRRERA